MLGQKLDIIIGLLQGGHVLASAELPQCAYSLYSWLGEWYKTYKVPKLKPASLVQIRICIDNHIKANLLDVPLDKLSALDIQKAMNRIQSSRMRKYAYDVLGASLRQAYKLDIVKENIMDKTEGVTHKRKQGKALTKEQQAKFMRLIKGNKLETLYKFYLLSGCRKSEPLSIKWTDIDYDNKLIHVTGTKTDNANRFIPLFPELELLLSTIAKKDKYVFPYNENIIKCNFRRLQTAYKLPYRIHDLRHTFATRCLENGINYKTVQKWLGHAQASTTLNIYSHVQTAFELEEVSKFKLV